MHKLLDIDQKKILNISAKLGTGVTKVLEQIIEQIPHPTGKPDAPARALVFDSFFDQYRGVVAYVRMIDGSFKAHDLAQLVAAQTETTLGQVGVLKPEPLALPVLSAGQTGFVETGLKDIKHVRVGDTLAQAKVKVQALPGYQPSEPKIYAALFPADQDKYSLLKEAIERLSLNDAALQFESIKSQALGAGFRVGFLGLLHLEITQERIKREFNVEIISTAPSVPYHIVVGEHVKVLQSPSELARNKNQIIEEPWARVEIITPAAYIGKILQLVTSRRGLIEAQDYLTESRVMIRTHMPMSDVIVGFFDQLKSVTQGFASLNYHLLDYRPADLVRLDILVAEEPVEASLP